MSWVRGRKRASQAMSWLLSKVEQRKVSKGAVPRAEPPKPIVLLNPCTRSCMIQGRLREVFQAPWVISPLCWRMRRSGLGVLPMYVDVEVGVWIDLSR